jgi:5-methyltetrahydropteroyltriglutamate--homocysteine methyltransferase
MCTGEIGPKGNGELEKDIANLKAAMARHGVERGFMNAASPGVISLFPAERTLSRGRPIWRRSPM